MTKVFVYGTLKSGYHNNYLLSRAHLLGEAMTIEPFVLLDCGFPMAVPYTNDETAMPLLPVMGEVWEVADDDLRRLDQLEGHPRWYERKKQVVRLGNTTEEVDMYVMPSHSTNRLSNIVDNMYYKWG